MIEESLHLPESTTMSGVYLCQECDFMVPAGDHIGVTIMRAHLLEHDKEEDNSE